MNSPSASWPITKWRQNELSPATAPESAPPPAPSEYETISGLLGILRRRWLTIGLVALGTLLLGLVACLLMTPKYSATATVEISPEEHGDSSGPSTYNGDELKSELQTNISILQGDGLALTVIKALGLGEKKPFSGAIAPSEKGRALEAAPRTREGMVRLFERFVKVDSPADTRLINITAQNPDANVAAQMANTLASKFIEDSLDRRHRSTTQSSYWLEKELGDLKGKVQASEQKLADYERESGLAGVQLTGSANGEGSSSVAVSAHNPVTERLFSLSQELTTAEANRISTETVYRLVRTQDPDTVLGLGAMSVSSGTGGGSTALTSDSGIELVRSLRGQEASLSREYAGISVKYGARNPRITDLQQQIDAIRQQMQAELHRISQRAENAFRYAKQNEEGIREQLLKQQGEANILNDKTVQLQVLGQEAYSNRALYESLFSKLQTASLASGSRASRIDLIDTATPAGSPSSPNYPKYLAGIMAVGVLLGLLTAFFRESLDETVRTSRDLDDVPRMGMLAYVPTDRNAGLLGTGESESQLITAPTAPFSEAFRALRTSILFAGPRGQMQTLLITSAIGGDGKTTVVYNLGIALAQQGARVLIIDGDMRNPDLHRRFHVERAPGLSESLSQTSGVELAGVVRHGKLPNLSLLPAGMQPELAAELFGSARFDSLLQACAARYDHVLIDSPPILAVTDAAIIAAKVDGILAVVRSRRTTRPLIAGLAQALERTNAPVLGFVLNDVLHPSLDGLYGYSYARETGKGVHANA